METTIHTKDDSTVGICQQTAWNTAAPPDSAFAELPNAQVMIDPDVRGRRPNRSRTSVDGGSRQVDVRDIQNDTKGNSPKLVIPGDVRKADIAYFLYGVMQNVTEAAATPFLKTFTFPSTQPDLTAITAVSSPGIVFSVCAKHPIASTSELITDAIITELSLSCAPGSGDARLQYSASFAGRGAIDDDYNPSGTWTRATEIHFPFHDLGGFKCNFGSAVTPNILSYDITLRNNAVPVGVETGGTGMFKTFALGMPYAANGTFVLSYDTVGDALQAVHGSGVDGTIDIWWGNETPSADGDLKISCNAVISPDSIREIDHNGIHALSFKYEAVTDKANSIDDSVTIIVCDGVDRNWVAA